MSENGRIAQTTITKKFAAGGRPAFTGGAGGYVNDADGRTFTDFVMGYGPVILGHAVEEFNHLVSRGLSHGLMMPGYTVFHDEYLERLLADRPGDRGAIFKTASEAVAASMRIAALETGRLGVIRCGYIGWHDAQISGTPKWHERLDSPLRRPLRYTENLRGVGPDEPVLNWLDLELASLAALLDEHQGRVGCFVFDAYLASMTTPEVIHAAVALCRRAGVLTVFDETKTGGRISRLGYAHDHRVAVDLIVIGKALANGAPLSIVVGGPELLAHTERSRLSGTFSKEMITMYAAMATLDLMEKPSGSHRDGWAALGEVGTRVAATFNEAALLAGVFESVRAEPVLGGGMFEFVYSDGLVGDRDRRSTMVDSFYESGILALEGHPSFVCMAHDAIEDETLLRQAHEALTGWVRTGHAR